MGNDIRVGKAWILAALLGWALFILPVLATTLLHGENLIQLDNDDAMRLVEVRDLIQGRGWFDRMQPRLGIEPGTWMHWSRLVDAPITGLILLLTPLLGQSGAEQATMVVWPLVVAFVPIAASAFAIYFLTGLRGAILGAVVMSQMLAHTKQFTPGSLDHHNVQIALLVCALCFAVVGFSRSRFAAAAGLAVAATIAVGVETLPHVAGLGVFMALLWAIQGETVRRPVAYFAAGLGISLVAIFAITAPPEAYSGGFCDSLSIDQALPILIGVLGLLAAIRFLSSQNMGIRLATLGAIGAVALAGAYFITPGCLANPVDQLDPFLKEVWFDLVSEVQPLHIGIWVIPTYLIPLVIIWCFAAVATAILIASGRHRSEWIIVALMLLAAMVMTLWQLRGALFIGVLSVLPLTCVVNRIYAYGEAQNRPTIRYAALLLFFLAVPQIWVIAALQFAPKTEVVDAGEAPPREGGRAFTGHLEDCYDPDGFSVLAGLPPGLVATGSNMGAFVLLHTPHSALSAPYHRNQAGMLAQFRIDFASDPEAEDMLRELGVDYVVNCRENPEFTVTDGSEPGFSFRLKNGAYPDFLVPVGPDQSDALIKVYQLAPQE